MSHASEPWNWETFDEPKSFHIGMNAYVVPSGGLKRAFQCVNATAGLTEQQITEAVSLWKDKNNGLGSTSEDD